MSKGPEVQANRVACGDFYLAPARPRPRILGRSSNMRESTNTDNLWRALEDVRDPEFPMSIVDLGLVYGIARESERVHVRITFTAMGCPAMEMILDDIRARLLKEPGVRAVEIEIVWDPPWTKSRLSERGRELLQSWGVAV